MAELNLHDDSDHSAKMANFVEIVRDTAKKTPGQQAFNFLPDVGAASFLTYGQLDQRALAIGARLLESLSPGERAVLVYPPGLEFIAALLGCFYAGVIAIPVPPPHGSRGESRFRAIVSDSMPSAALSCSWLTARLNDQGNERLAQQDLPWIATDLLEGLCQDRVPIAVSTDMVALLQYTSGSTAEPRGVILTHANLLDNSRRLQQVFQYSSSTRCVSWLPPYHDMGLIGAILQPLYGRFPCTLMSPVSFLQRPYRWLQAISEGKASLAGGPNFAYDFCVRKVTPEQRDNLDLSHWTVAFNAAEPVRAETLDRFAATFEPCGFRRDAFLPCYGLAEGTLIVSGEKRTRSPSMVSVNFPEVELHPSITGVETTREQNSRHLVGCGGVSFEEVAIVDSKCHRRQGPGEVGEIWVSNASVAQGYWNRPKETADTFHACLGESGNPRFYLRTGDVGFVTDGELFVTGRIKELIIIRGCNYYPTDIEFTVERSHPVLRPHSGAAFSIGSEDGERLAIVQELDRRTIRQPLEPVFDAIRGAVSREHGLHVHQIFLIKHGTILKTTSGKIARIRCKAAALRGELSVIAASVVDEPGLKPGSDLVEKPSPPIECSTEDQIRQHLGALLGRDMSRVRSEQRLLSLGMDSLAAVELANWLEATFAVPVPVSEILAQTSISDIAGRVERAAHGGRRGHEPSLSPKPIAGERSLEYGSLLSSGQRALWFLEQLSPGTSVYNISRAMRIRGPLQVDDLRAAFQYLVARHASLRSRFSHSHGEPARVVQESMDVPFEHLHAADWTDERIEGRLMQDARRTFDLENGPLVRITLISQSPDKFILLFAVHHLIADFWSLTILLKELLFVYGARQSAGEIGLRSPRRQYSEFVRWQSQMLKGPEGQRLLNYWRRQLAGDRGAVTLPTDRPRPRTRSNHGSSHHFEFDARLTDGLKKLSLSYETTLYVTLLSAFQVLLYRYTGQADLLIGTLTAGRTRPEFAELVGYFVNPVVLRVSASKDVRFPEFLHRVRETVLGAIEHQDYPFAQLVEQLKIERDPSTPPLFQVLFAWQRAPLGSPENLEALALGIPGTQVRGALSLEAIELPTDTAQFDLTFTAGEIGGSIRGFVEYNPDLFDAKTIKEMCERLRVLLDGIVADPQRRISEFPLLSEPERRRVLVDWNATDASWPENPLIHDLIEAQAARTPDAIAVVFEQQQISYRELNRRADHLAKHLRDIGAAPEVRLGVCLERSLEMVVAILAILKSGAAYVPLDPAHPRARLLAIQKDLQIKVLVTQRDLIGFASATVRVVCVDDGHLQVVVGEQNLPSRTVPRNLAYVICTSGSTGTPKGVMITHENVVNFFRGMDELVGCSVGDTLLAVTSLSFDISVLELLWTLTRGARVVLLSDQALHRVPRSLPSGKRKLPDLSLFYFASEQPAAKENRYRLLLQGARFADRHGFAAVWTPERHFHPFGGLFPNPSVLGAALANITEKVAIRAGSVVLPLHAPVRVAEEWSVVDNLSKGRVGIAFASGWHADDFVFFPDHYCARKEIMFRDIETVRKLWRGDPVTMQNGGGADVQVRIFPRPIQEELPTWITAAGSADTFRQAGLMGANVLTHLLGQSVQELAEKVSLYREAREKNGRDPLTGCVTLMLHTFVGAKNDWVRDKVRGPFREYLRSSVDLISNLAKSMNLDLDLSVRTSKDMDAILDFAFDRYFETSGLFGTPKTCLRMLETLESIGIDEVGCLIDFGVDEDSVLRGLNDLNELKTMSRAESWAGTCSMAAQAGRYSATLLQTTPSMAQMLLLDEATREGLQSLRAWLVGGESLSSSLASDLKSLMLPNSNLFNLYGPTETTVWSSGGELDGRNDSVTIGRPITNTRIYILDKNLEIVPPGVVGEIFIAGSGLARGYDHSPALTAEAFRPDPFAPAAGRRMYGTGDLARFKDDGGIEFLGRINHNQLKIRGYRIDVREIEKVLLDYPGVRQAVVVSRGQGDERSLAAYLVHETGTPLPSPLVWRGYLQEMLPKYMIPSSFVTLPSLPMTANGKLDRGALPVPGTLGSTTAYVAPRTDLEVQIARVWKDALRVEKVGIEDNFFDLGGHSLLMAQVHSRLRAELLREFDLIRMFEHPTVTALAQYLSERAEDATSLAERARELARKQKEGIRRKRERPVAEVEAI